jgi:hypothetical protein
MCGVDDVVVVSVHWGANWGYEIPDAQRRFAHALIDRTNVSVIHGHRIIRGPSTFTAIGSFSMAAVISSMTTKGSAVTRNFAGTWC